MKTEIRNKVSLYLFGILLVAAGACKESPAPQDPNAALWTHPRCVERFNERKRMVDRIRDYYGLDDKRTLDAMLQVPRHWFVPENMQSPAYADGPLPIGHGQTISQPFIVAFMTSILKLDPNDVVLEVGTGSGYQAAVLTEFTPHVYSIEIVTPLAETAKKTLEQRGYKTVQTRCGDGYQGWPEHSPFDAIIVTCAPDHIPAPLLEQLKPDGKIIIPVGDEYGIQDLFLVTKGENGKVSKKSMMPVRFVPLIRK
jgi:protein-L-isoaspartate(D-aspartate) O-methyltransferase